MFFDIALLRSYLAHDLEPSRKTCVLRAEEHQVSPETQHPMDDGKYSKNLCHISAGEQHEENSRYIFKFVGSCGDQFLVGPDETPSLASPSNSRLMRELHVRGLDRLVGKSLRECTSAHFASRSIRKILTALAEALRFLSRSCRSGLNGCNRHQPRFRRVAVVAPRTTSI